MSLYSILFYVIVVLILITIIIKFNKMIFLRNATKNTFSQVDILIRKRTNILKNIAIIIEKETNHEKEVFTKIAELRTSIFTDYEIQEAQSEVRKTNKISKQIFAIQEAYPALKVNSSFTNYIAEMTKVENEIMRMRHVYNNVIETYNNYIQTFPNSLLAKIFTFESKDFLEY